MLKLDRPVVGRTPIPIPTPSLLRVGTPLYTIGHPVGLPMKFGGGAEVKQMAEGQRSMFLANLDTYAGNSGSPIFNGATNQVVGLLVGGEADFVLSEADECCLSNMCPDQGCPGFERASLINPIVPFVRQVDDLLVTPTAAVVTHTSPIGMMPPVYSPGTYIYEMSTSGDTPITWRIEMSSPTQLGPITINGTTQPLTGVLTEAQGPLRFVVSLNQERLAQIPDGYTVVITFRDLTRDTNSTRVHRTQQRGCGDGICDIEESCASCRSDCCPNDECSSALTIPEPFPRSVQGSTLGATDDKPYASACTGTSQPKVWFRIQVERTGVLLATTCSMRTDFDTVVALFTSCDSPAAAACNDDAPSCGFSSVLAVNVQPGEYLVMVTGYGGFTTNGTGHFELFINFAEPAGSEPASFNLTSPESLPTETASKTSNSTTNHAPAIHLSTIVLLLSLAIHMPH